MDFPLKASAGFAIVKVRNAAAIPDVLRELGVDPDGALRRAGIEPALFANPENDLPYQALGRLVREGVLATGCEDFGLRVGARKGATAIGLTGLLSMHAPTVRDALRLIAAGLRTSDTGGAVILEEGDDEASCGYVVIAANIEGADQIVDGAMAILLNTMRSLAEPAWRPARVRLTRELPRDKTPFTRFFAAPVEFGAPSAALVFQPAILDAPVRDRNPEHAEILRPLYEEALAKTESDFLSAARLVIRSYVLSGALSRDAVCRALGLNARTLSHRLEKAGVTFSALADDAKYEAARQLLMKDRRPAEIAAILGFAEQSAFTRAFKSWSGATPSRWRRERGWTFAGRPIP